ncbi:hypothetical protein AAG906_020824 [Vitis piasezkii]
MIVWVDYTLSLGFEDLCNAGTDTSAGSMQWAIAKFINYPDAFKMSLYKDMYSWKAGADGHGAKLIRNLARHVLEHGVDAAIFTLQNRCRKTLWQGITPGSGKPQLMAGRLELRPATLAEFTLDSLVDFYDVSLVDRYNMLELIFLPTDLNQRCPKDLQVLRNGTVVACNSACMAFNKPEYCCSGAYSTPETSKPTEYSKLFKASCPTSYS